MIVNILIGNAIVGTLFVGLFTLRHLVKLRRELAESRDSADAPPEPMNERRPQPNPLTIGRIAPVGVFVEEDPKEPQTVTYRVHTNAWTPDGGGGGAVVCVKRYIRMDKEKLL